MNKEDYKTIAEIMNNNYVGNCGHKKAIFDLANYFEKTHIQRPADSTEPLFFDKNQFLEDCGVN